MKKHNLYWAQSLLVLFALFGITLYAYSEALFYLLNVWNDIEEGEYAHGYLVLAISAYLIFINRKRLYAQQPCPQPWVLILLAASVVFWIVATVVDVQVAEALGLWGVLACLIWLVLGTRIALILMFPVAYVLFAIPFWFPLSQVLQDITADIVFAVTRLLNMPTYRQDNLIVMASGSLSIEEACSGLRYLLAMLTLSSLYAYLNYRRFWSRVLVVVLASLAAVLSNLIRVFIVVYLGYVTDMQHPLVKDHLMLGWYLFSGIVMVLLVLDVWFARKFALSELQETVESAFQEKACHVSNGRWLVYSGALLLLLCGPLVLDQLDAHNDRALVLQADPDRQLILAEQIGDWRHDAGAEDDWQPVFIGAKTAKAVYRKQFVEASVAETPKAPVTFYTAYYAGQKQGEELIYELNSITNHRKWRTRYARGRVFEIDGEAVLEQLVSNGVRQKLVWYQYDVAGRVVTNKYLAKILQALAVMQGKPEAAVRVMATDIDDTKQQARQRLQDFLLSGERLRQNGGLLYQYQ